MQKITLKIDGMACGMCEAHVNESIRKSFAVRKVTSSHRRGETVILSEQAIDENALKNAINNTGYTVLSVSVEQIDK